MKEFEKNKNEEELRENEPIKRGRGRPRKLTNLESQELENQKLEKQDEEQEKVKRKRGRPRKRSISKGEKRKLNT